MTTHSTSPDARATLRVGERDFTIFRLDAAGVPDLARLPYTVKVLLENMLRGAATQPELVSADDVRALAAWDADRPAEYELPFMPARVILQDFTGVPCVVDLAAMRDAMGEMGGDPSRINPLVPVDLVIDHSVQVDQFGTDAAFLINVEREYERNGERYALLRWAQQAFDSFRVVPPGTGIVHQVNLEFLADVISERDGMLFPDTLVGTDSHTTMVNGLGVAGWGVGGIEAEAAMLGQPLPQPMPVVVGFRLDGELPAGSTATDLVLTVTEMLRAHGVVGKFVEFHGPGLSRLSLADRATISNMSPEFGATATLFPIDEETLRYLRMTGRPEEVVARVEAYAREQGLFRTDATPAPDFNESLSLDLASVVPSVAGPRRPQDRVALTDLRDSFRATFPDGLHTHADGTTHEHGGEPAEERGTVEEASTESFPASDPPSYTRDPKAEQHATEAAPRHAPVPAPAGAHYRAVEVEQDGERFGLRSGSVVIAAITSCTNTSNPSVMVAAGLVAQKALERGLTTRPWVKTSLAPGSRAVTDYLAAAGLMEPLEAQRFNLVGYGCTTCIGNSGPLAEPIAAAIEGNDLVGVAVLSGNRNFEGRIHPLARASYLASPPLVVAFALAGRIDIDLASEPLGTDADGRDVFLADIWPSPAEVADVVARAVSGEIFSRNYASVFDGDDRWRNLPVPAGDRYAWDPASTYVARPPFFDGLGAEPAPLPDVEEARVLAVLGDSVTTDHISPAGSIARTSPAGEWLVAHGVEPRDFNSYGARRGHHEVMMRGTFANIRLRNALTPDAEGNVTEHIPSGVRMSIFDAAMRYAEEGTPLIVLAGREYGSGSSRDWAAKGPYLQGVRAVIAESYERIHRSNLVGMGIVPLQYLPGESAASLGLTGRETFTIRGVADLRPRQEVSVTVRDEDGGERTFRAIARVDGPVDLEYLRHGGVLQAVLRRLAVGDADRSGGVAAPEASV
ncbi:MAG TPA: aconitate hydratase [Candidatus Limnocylindria bacterium]|nr:aconitate hydratase [Candidatus Limnocylindria bacterium]